MLGSLARFSLLGVDRSRLKPFTKCERSLNAMLTVLCGHSHTTISRVFRRGLPDIVCSPQNVQHVQSIVRVCNENRVPVIPFGTGTGLEGGVCALEVSITL